MATTIVRKTFENHDKNSIFSPTSYIVRLNKFVLKAFNQLYHNNEINKQLVASFLFDLLNYYFLKVAMKTINIALLKAKF